jgi:hypothetical protein
MIIASVAKLVINFLVIIKLAYQIYLVTLTALIVLQAQKGITQQIDVKFVQYLIVDLALMGSVYNAIKAFIFKIQHACHAQPNVRFVMMLKIAIYVR